MTRSWVVDDRVRWCWLEIGDAALMLQDDTAQALEARRAAGPVGLGVTIDFMCDDALAIYTDAKQRGLAPSQPFVGNGMWVTTLSDPGGYRVEFESATDIAEGTVYEG